jgi:hypothetical protein
MKSGGLMMNRHIHPLRNLQNILQLPQMMLKKCSQVFKLDGLNSPSFLKNWLGLFFPGHLKQHTSLNTNYVPLKFWQVNGVKLFKKGK